METHPTPAQDPSPGAHIVRFQGDVLTFALTLSHPFPGHAWLRSNIGRAAITRGEILAEIETGTPRLAADWFDLPMQRRSAKEFDIRVPLSEIGHFEAKAYFLPEGSADPLWPAGPNTAVNVQPADTCCANIVYNAFVRQFGPNKRTGGFPSPSSDERVQALDHAGYSVIPPSGTFRDLIAELDFIIGRLGCTHLQLLPIHPTPTIYARMGRFGSPYAALSFTAVDPALAEFDPAATPLEQFIELVDAIHRRHAKVLIDIAINHTGWAASLHETHPDWLVRDGAGRIEAPGAWGVTWADLTRLDYSNQDLWAYMAEVFLTWCRRGVDGFRCDAGYMIPVPAWTYIIAKVREQYPETLFLLEGLGGPMAVTRDLLNRAGFNWAYSELFQNYDRGQIEHYLPAVFDISAGEGLMIHFAETHDNNRLAARSSAWARMRTALCALSSVNGAFAFANGVEWLATEKINVHEAASLNWGAEPNQVAEIARLSRLISTHPAFHDQVELTLVAAGEGNHLVLLRRHRPTGRKLIVAVNLDDQQTSRAAWKPIGDLLEAQEAVDLISDRDVRPSHDGPTPVLNLEAGQVLCLSADPADRQTLQAAHDESAGIPPRALHQRLRARALAVHAAFNGVGGLGDADPDELAERLYRDPAEFCRLAHPGDDSPRTVTWRYPRDIRREVMVPPGHCLLLRAEAPMQGRLMAGERCLESGRSLPQADGSQFILFRPLAAPEKHQGLTLSLKVFAAQETLHLHAPLLCLAPAEQTRVRCYFPRGAVRSRDLLALDTNRRGAMLRAKADWGALGSRYDALLAVNADPRIPVNRHILLTRCRAWVVFQGYSQEICSGCLDGFGFAYQGGTWWRFRVPTGQGQNVRLTVRSAMVPGQNRLLLSVYRHGSRQRPDCLADDRPVRLIIRPDIENRGFHDLTKAFTGPETAFPAAVQPSIDGFTFAPAGGLPLAVRMPGARFVPEPEWQYMVYRPQEAQRGQDPDSDLFSPGYFTIALAGDGRAVLEAGMDCELGPSAAAGEAAETDPPVRGLIPTDALRQAMAQYVVQRGALKSVIAGYPWFLDWGRDALIFTRGLIAAGMRQEAREVLDQFGRFEHDGTLPNMIVGEDAGNRDTADAPLWFAVACAELMRAEGSRSFLEEACGGRTIRQVLFSIGRSLMRGTFNGLHCEPRSGLLYSPAHFTWMDTDHPAGTPRAGYPIEIQALWHRTLRLLADISDDSEGKEWELAARTARESIRSLYPLPQGGYLSDCLHAAPGTPARQADADDALRPNQLFAITLGAIDDPRLCRGILAACEELLVPGAIRSLADRPVRHPLAIVHHGQALNDPHRPYQGTYVGDEDRQRKPAYHNGTAWTWVFPSFCEAWAAVYGQKARATALAWLSSAVRLVNRGCVGHVPEILDGDAPHAQRGCDAQAWGASEVFRVWSLLAGN